MLRFQIYFYQELSIHLLDTLARAGFLDLHDLIRELSCKEEKMINGDQMIALL